MESQEPVKVYDAWNLLQAHLLCQLLAEAGITARVASDALEMVIGEVPFQKASCPVWVLACDVERARSILADYDDRLKRHKSSHSQSEDTYCYHCGDPVPSGQSPCPNCGHELDWTLDA